MTVTEGRLGAWYRFALHRFLIGTPLVVVGLLLSATVANALGPNAVRPGFNSTELPANDDGSTAAAVPLGFTVNFFGTNYSSVFVNNNGNVTFDTALGDFTPFDLTSTAHVIVAPFFADVDTRVGNTVTYGTGLVDGHAAFGVNWPGVGCFDQNTNVVDFFQVVLIDRSDVAAGSFDIEFNYDQIQWDTGQADGGDANCLGQAGQSQSARAGYSNGSGAPNTSFELPGSGVPGSFLDSNSSGLIHASLNSMQLGRYVFGVRGPSVCGNGVIEQGEQCDDGATNGTPADCCSGTCQFQPLGTTCNDGDGCTQTDQCDGSGKCVGSNPILCLGDQCHSAGNCDPATGQCTNSFPDGTQCDDNDSCTTADTCKGGSCVGSPVVCQAADQCHSAGTCDPATGQCSNLPKPDGTQCDDNNSCTTTDTCQSGSCLGSPVVCQAADQCHDAGTCDLATGQCSNPLKPDGTPCDDNNVCTTTDACQGGVCAGTGSCPNNPPPATPVPTPSAPAPTETPVPGGSAQVAPENSTGSPGETVKAGVFQLDNQLNETVTILCVTIDASNPAILDNGTLSAKAGGQSSSQTSNIGSSTQFCFNPPLVVPVGSAADFTLNVTIAKGLAAARTAALVYAGFFPPLDAADSSRAVSALALVWLAGTLFLKRYRRLLIVLLILMALSPMACGGGGGGGNPRGPNSTLSVTDVVAQGPSGRVGFSGLPAVLGTVTAQP